MLQYAALDNIGAMVAAGLTNVITAEFVEILISLLSIQNEQLLLQNLKVAVGLTHHPALLTIVRELSLTSTIIKLLMAMPSQDVSAIFGREVSKYLLNISIGLNEAQMHKLVHVDEISEALMHLLEAPNLKPLARHTTIQAVQNVLTFKDNCLKCSVIFFDPLIKFMKSHHDLSAIRSLFNVSCVPECRALLVQHSIHYRVLEFMAATKNSDAKAMYLRVLVQVYQTSFCIRFCYHINHNNPYFSTYFILCVKNRCQARMYVLETCWQWSSSVN